MDVELRMLDPRLAGWGFPHRGSALAAGLDLHACLDGPLRLAPGAPPVQIPAGFALRIGDAGFCGLVAPRSGLGHRGLVLGNTIGVIDADFDGPVLLSVWNRNPSEAGEGGIITLAPGDRIAQLLIVPVVVPRLRLVEHFSGASARGSGGFGSTGTAPTGLADPA